jgi:DNA-binding transcriptional regulator GbsR (MarR family)
MYLIIGIILFIVSASDIIYTVLSSNGAGYFSKYAMKYCAAVFQFLARSTNSRNILKYAGVSLLSSITVVWVLLLWLGVFLIFLYDQNSVLDSTTLIPAGTIDRFYFSGYLLSTLGNGDFKPQAGVWQIAATLFTFSGFIFLTTAITYFVSILGSITEKRLAAISIFNLGASSSEITSAVKKLHHANQLMSEVSSIKNHLNRLTLNHTSYPISHNFFAVEKNRSISIAAAELHHALEDLRENEKTDENLSAQLEPLRDALGNYLQTLAQRFLADLLKGKVAVNEESIKEAEVRQQVIHALLYSDVWIEKLPDS